MHAAIQELGAQVLVVSFTPPDKAAAYLAKYPVPFPVACDPERKGYTAFGLGRATWGRIFGLRSVLGYLGIMLRGWMPRKPLPKDDPLQLGGDFVLDGQRRIVLARPSSDPTDRPTGAELLEAVRGLVQPTAV